MIDFFLNSKFLETIGVAVITALAIILGSLISFRGTKRIEEKSARRNLTISLYNEFHSKSMTRHRKTTISALSSRTGRTFDQVYNALNSNDQESLSIYMHYLEKVSTLAQADAVDKDLLQTLLGRYFTYWLKNGVGVLAMEPKNSEWYDLLSSVKKLENFAK